MESNPLSRFLPILFFAVLLGETINAQVNVQAHAVTYHAVRLPAPSFAGKISGPTGKTAQLPLKQISATPNGITDDQDWFDNNHLTKPFYQINAYPFNNADELPSIVPTEVEGAPLKNAWWGKSKIYCCYADSILLIADSATHNVEHIYDLGLWCMNKVHKKEDEWLIRQEIQWAVVVDTVLYVSNFHRTYAATYGNQNAYITAINLKTDSVIWRTPPLKCNALTFEVDGDLVFCGYGFTMEPDFMYVLDRYNGTTVQKAFVKTGPDYIIRKDEKLFVRTYNTDYIFQITTNKLVH